MPLRVGEDLLDRQLHRAQLLHDQQDNDDLHAERGNDTRHRGRRSQRLEHHEVQQQSKNRRQAYGDERRSEETGHEAQFVGDLQTGNQRKKLSLPEIPVDVRRVQR